ncbi:RNA chaperone Hfq [Acidobacteria bacterium AH-259-A15]|nr:RNA chaperone Hfq [Acidobacteria bacterium AH-259-A15]
MPNQSTQKVSPRKRIPLPTYVQDVYLATLLKTKRRVILYLSNGGKLPGKIQRFDQYCVLFFTRNRQVLVFKHAIVSIKPEKPTEEEGIFKLTKKARDDNLIDR